MVQQFGFADFFAEFKSVHIWHHNVSDDDVRYCLIGFFKSLVSVFSKYVVILGIKLSHHISSHLRSVFDDEYYRRIVVVRYFVIAFFRLGLSCDVGFLYSVYLKIICNIEFFRIGFMSFYRQCDDKHRAFANGGVNVNFSTHFFNCYLYNRQSYTGANVWGVLRYLIKWGENIFFLLRTDTDTRIADENLNIAIIYSCCNIYFAVRIGKFNCVRNEVAYYFLYVIRDKVHIYRFFLRRKDNADFLFSSITSETLTQHRDKFNNITVFPLWWLCYCSVHLGNVQNLIYKVEKSLFVGQNVRSILINSGAFFGIVFKFLCSGLNYS